MKAFLVAAIFALAGVQTPAPDNGVIEGRVLRLGNSDPIAEARVIISRVQPNLPDTPEARDAAASVAMMNQSELERSARPGFANLLRSTFTTADREVAVGLPDGSLTPSFQSAVLTDSEGNFRFARLPAGRYLTQVNRTGYFSPSTLEGSPSMSVLSTTTVEAGKSTPPVNLFLLRGGIISGMILDPMGRPAAKVAVSPYTMTYFGVDLVFTMCCGNATTDDRGEFRISGIPSIIRDAPFDAKGTLTLNEVPSGKYLAGVFILPKSGCVSDIRQDGKSVLDTGFSPLGDVSPVQFLVNPTCATVSGVVKTADQRPASRALVVLVPPKGRRWNIEMYRDVRTDDTGHFSITGVAPGSYTIFAWTITPQFAWRNAEFLSRYEGQGLSINVVGTAPVDANPSLISADTNFPKTLR